MPVLACLASSLPFFFAERPLNMSSSSFDLGTNLASGDSRAGLDDQGRKEVQRLMRKHRVGSNRHALLCACDVLVHFDPVSIAGV